MAYLELLQSAVQPAEHVVGVKKPFWRDFCVQVILAECERLF